VLHYFGTKFFGFFFWMQNGRIYISLV